MRQQTMKHFTRTLIAGCAASLMATAALADEAVITESFYPYKTETPQHEGLEPGMVIDQSNVAQFKDIIDPAFYGFIEQGWTTIVVGETTSFDLHPSYVEATRLAMDQVTLGEKVGEINGWQAGRPFPEEPSSEDPRAGEKLAWNYKYGYNWGDSAAISPFYWKYRDMNSGDVERTIKFNFHFLNYKGRVNQEPTPEITPNPSDLFRAIYVQVLDPADVRDTQLLIHRAADDLKRDNFEPAADVAETLLENNVGIAELYELAGEAAFAINDFETVVCQALKMATDVVDRLYNRSS